MSIFFRIFAPEMTERKIMRRYLFLVIVWMMSLSGVGMACMKKSIPLVDSLNVVSSPLTIIVSDTAQSLLPDVEMRIGKTAVLRTSWDGRLVVSPELLSHARKITFSCEGYEPLTMDSLPTHEVKSPVVLIALTPKPDARRKGGDGRMRVRSGSKALSSPADDVYYSLGTSSKAMPRDMLVAEEEVMPLIGTGRAVHNDASAGMLTAGEVNDFTKWYFWSHVLDSTHRQFIDEWQLEPRHRYTVQLTNKNGYPIASRAVSLLDAKGNTLYQAVTDNTGKAELWADGMGYGLQVTGYVLPVTGYGIRVDDQTIAAKEWEFGLNTIVSDEPYEVSNDVDVMFVFDATGSMGDELRYLCAEMKDVIARATEATGGLAIRTGALVYRDHGDEYLNRLSRLTSDIAATQAFIDQQHASGGGDYEEAVPEALMAALNSGGWNAEARARIAFLILDAPCHQDSATLALLHEQILNAAALGVRIVPVVCSGINESAEFMLRSVALLTNGTSFFLTDDSGIGHTHLKPTTDSLKVEHLNDMMVRTIVEFSYMPDGSGHWNDPEEDYSDFIPNPFDTDDLSEEQRIAKDSPTTLYLLDMNGKLIAVYEGRLEEASDGQLSRLHLPMLSTGVYFVKAFYDGEWHTKKILVH